MQEGEALPGAGQSPSPSFLCPWFAPFLESVIVCLGGESEEGPRVSEREMDRLTDRPQEGERGARNPALPASVLLSPSRFSGTSRNLVFSLGFLRLFICSHTCVVCMGYACVVYVVQHVMCYMV